jgi:hypothetical protein
MGILKLKGDPCPREPVVLINEAFANSASALEVNSANELIVEVAPAERTQPPSSAAEAFIMCTVGEMPSVWVSKPIPQCVGRLRGRGADVIREFIRSARTGLCATLIVSMGEAGTSPGLQVRVPWGSARL